MANIKSFINLNDLEALLGLTQGALDHDRRAALIVAKAENLVREVAEQPGWVGEDPEEGQTLATETARFIALDVAKRAIESAGNVVRRGAGPISITYRTDGITEVELTDAERARLERQRPGGASNGFWVLKVQTGARRRRDGSRDAAGNIYAPGGELLAGPDMYWAYGVEP